MIIKACIIPFGKIETNHYFFPEDVLMAIPGELPVTVEFNGDKIVGIATNIEKRNDGFYADIDLTGYVFRPGGIAYRDGSKVTEFTISEISMIPKDKDVYKEN
jgi:hypothetical protein